MAIVFPLALPVAKFQQHRFDLTSKVVNTLSGTNELLDAFELTDPTIELSFTTEPMTISRISEWDSFASKLKGAMGTFQAHDDRRQWPAAHPDGFAGWNGQGTVSAWQVNGDITLAGIPTTFKLTEGDWIGIENATGFKTVVRALETSTAGVTRTLAVRGKVNPAAFPATSVIKLYQPKATFRLMSYSVGEGSKLNEVTVTARQSLR
jgi:hypothetical protein